MYSLLQGLTIRLEQRLCQSWEWQIMSWQHSGSAECYSDVFQKYFTTVMVYNWWHSPDTRRKILFVDFSLIMIDVLNNKKKNSFYVLKLKHSEAHWGHIFSAFLVFFMSHHSNLWVWLNFTLTISVFSDRYWSLPAGRWWSLTSCWKSWSMSPQAVARRSKVELNSFARVIYHKCKMVTISTANEAALRPLCWQMGRCGFGRESELSLS